MLDLNVETSCLCHYSGRFLSHFCCLHSVYRIMFTSSAAASLYNLNVFSFHVMKQGKNYLFHLSIMYVRLSWLTV